jgi:hypothetical protein
MKTNLTDSPIDASAIAEAASAHARINVPLNLENWEHLPAETQEALMWFHQHLLDEGLGWEEAASALGYASEDKDAAKTIFAALKGTIDAEKDWSDLVERIGDFRKIAAERAGIQTAAFVETPNSKTVWAALDYALSSISIALIEGESGHGKTVPSQAWIKQRAAGRAVYVEVPSIGGTRVFLGEICKKIGANKNLGIGQMRDAILRAFDRNRILIVDEATRLLPKDRRTMPEKLEFLRELHDRTSCAVALLCTSRLNDEMETSNYLFEQVLGRSLPIRLPYVLGEANWRPILVQYFPRPSEKLLKACEQIANNKMRAGERGRLRTLVKTLQLATRMASKDREDNPRIRLNEEHFFKALAMRQKFAKRQIEQAQEGA